MHLNGFTTETKLPLNHAVPAGEHTDLKNFKICKILSDLWKDQIKFYI